MTKLITAFLSGLIFGLGLTLSQMVNPNKVLAFLDVAGAWDPSLALVMAGALLTLGLARLWIKQHKQLPVSHQPEGLAGITIRLIFGAAIFGIGWGLSGFCPGPALMSLTYGITNSYLFVAALFSGFALYKWIYRD